MSAKFRFTLQPVLDARVRTEDDKLRRLAVCRRALDDAARDIERKLRSRHRCMTELVAAAHEAYVADLRVRDAYLRRLDAALAEESLRRGELLGAWEAARDAVIAARRARRTFEQLKERRRRAFEAEEARREELDLDESNARAFDRARRERPAAEQAGSAAS